MFANLDIKERSDMVLNEVVESVYDLFSEQKNVELDLAIASEPYHILGDKNHLIRVLIIWLSTQYRQFRPTAKA